MNHSSIRTACHLAVGVVVAALVVRTWVAMGLVVPVTVAGSSMAPTLLGPHRTFACQTCGQRFPVGLDQLPPDDRAVCPHCGRRDAVATAAADHGGAHLVVDRATFAWRSPGRWEAVVFRSPQMADQLWVKRVVGLPGETVSLAGGDVWIDGWLVRKTLAQQRAVRQLVDRLDAGIRIPPGPEPGGAIPTPAHWQSMAADEAGGVRWLVYRRPDGGPVTDDLSYNQRVSHELHPMHDLMLSFRARLEGDGQLLWRVAGRGGAYVVAWDARRRSVQLRRGENVVARRPLPPDELPRGAWTEWTFSLFDRQVLVAIDGRVVLVVPDDAGHSGQVEVDSGEPSAAVGGRCAPPQPPGGEIIDGGLLAVGTGGLRGEIRDLAVWRDVYYERRPADRPPSRAGAAGGGWRLGPGQLFVVGDNAAVSDDSRSWLAGPGLDAKLVIGKPLGVR